MRLTIQVFRIVSLNVWGGAVFDALATWLPTMGADVICLQEVTRTPDLAGWTRFEDAERSLPQRANLFADVCELLPHHVAGFAASDAGPVLDMEGNTHQQDFGLAVFVHERHSVIEQRTSFVHGEFTIHDEWGISERPRIAQAIRVCDPRTNRTFMITHLHGLRDPAGKGDTPARTAQGGGGAEILSTMTL
jgi:hypothetical protein